MPVIEAKKPGTCTVCSGRIHRTEYCHYERATGTVHLECHGQPAQRTNGRAAPCAACGRQLQPGEGRMEDAETRTANRFKSRWRVTCLRGCQARHVESKRAGHV